MSRERAILTVVQTDATFERQSHRGTILWVGKCIHCNRRLMVSELGQPLGHATLEHIVPRSHGGGETPDNLALACARCNHQKGYRIDNRRPDDERARAVIDGLAAKRRARWRDPEGA